MWRHGAGSEMEAHVATITLTGVSIREPLQRACLPIEKQAGDTGGKSSLKKVSHAKSSSCQLSPHRNMSPLPAHSPTCASGPLQDAQYPSQRLREDTIFKS